VPQVLPLLAVVIAGVSGSASIRRGGRWRDILHAPIRVEGGKMKRYIRTEPFPNPSAQGLNLGC
jgi:hypothetical protein